MPDIIISLKVKNNLVSVVSKKKSGKGLLGQINISEGANNQ